MKRIPSLVALGAALLLAGCWDPTLPPPPEKEVFEMTVGQTKRLYGGDGLWFAQPDEEYSQDLGRIEIVARVELECKGQKFSRSVVRNRQTEPACGVRLRLLGLQTDAPIPRATFELNREPAPKP